MDRDVDDPAFDKHLLARIREAKDTFRTALIGSSDIRQQAVGFALQVSDANSAQHPDGTAALDALATLATSTSDPIVYALAVRICGNQLANTGIDRCGAISTEGLSQVDPDNGAVWLELAGEAVQRQDAAAEIDALHKAAGAHRMENDTDSLLAIAAPLMPSGLTLLEQYYLTIDVSGLQAALSIPYMRGAADCVIVAQAHPDLMGDCSAIAEHMVSSGRALSDLGTGARLGEKAGWPLQRVAGLRREQQALMMLLLAGPRDLNSPQSCHDAVREAEKMRQRSAIGEVAALRAELQSSGLTIEEEASQFDQWMAATTRKLIRPANAAAH